MHLMRTTSISILLLVCTACLTEGFQRQAGGPGPQRNRKKLEGPHTYSYSNGKTQAQGNYSQDRQTGRWTYWYDDGAKEWEVGFQAEQFEGPAKWWWPNGQPHAYGGFSAGLEVGAFTYWGESGKIACQGDFDAGSPNGAWTSWREDGSPKAAGMQWKGARVGRWHFFDANGTAHVHDFGLPEGLKTHLEEWPNGMPRREGFVEHGQPVGRWSTRHENGVRRASGRILDGQPDGQWCFYRPDGTLLASAHYSHGEAAREMQVFDGMNPANVSSNSIRIREVAGAFSSTDEAAGRPVGDVVSTWMSEALSKLEQNVEHKEAASSEPASDQLSELARRPVLPLRRQPWTESELDNMNFLVQLYTDGAPNMAVPPGGGQYASSHRVAGVTKLREGDKERSAPLIGQKLGSTKVRTRDGAALDLHSLEGKPLVVVILRGMAGEICVYCYTQVMALCRTMPEFQAAGANIVVIYPGPAERLDVFWKALREDEEMAARAAPFTFAYDADLALVKSLAITGKLALPTTLVLDKGGTIRFAYVGEDTADRPDAKRLVEIVRGLDGP